MVLLIAAGGCAWLQGRRAKAKRTEVVSASLKAEVVEVLAQLRRGLKSKIWDNLADVYDRGVPAAYREMKQRTEALWKRGQILELNLELGNIRREKDLYLVRVRWQRTLLERGEVKTDDGECQIFLKRSEERLKVFGASLDAFF